jgi:hypothetical protein
MSALAATSLLIVLSVLAAVAFGPSVVRAVRSRRRRLRAAGAPSAYDPGRERRAERRARELMRGVVGAEEYEMYVELGFIRVVAPAGGRRPGYGYLIYPHRPIVAYDTDTGELLSEYCVDFPDHDDPAAGALPGADDVLAKWMALHGDERGLISDANMHLPGRQVDPGHVRRDLRRLAEWEAQRTRAPEPSGA